MINAPDGVAATRNRRLRLYRQDAPMAENRKPPQFPSEIARRIVSMPGGMQSDPVINEGHKKLVVGREITLAGEITDCDILVVEGTVRASLQDSRRFEITETGVFEGKVEIDVAEIKGRFEGELTARGRLLIRRTGQVVGRIRYAELEIERGGQVSGDVQVIADAAVPRLTDEIKRSRFGSDGADTGLHLERENDIRA
jgi:cytoskeletal protein CcmA (bactofilin family)